MDMRINAKLIRSERERRAWSQEHLATVTGLGTRTVQRVEKTGVASLETAKAIASVLELDIDQLRTRSTRTAENRARLFWRGATIAAGFAVALLTALFWTRSVNAGQVMLDLGLTLNDEKLSNGQMIVESGKEAEIDINKLIKGTIVPISRPNGSVFLELRLYEYDGTNFVLGSSPRLLAEDNVVAEVKATTDRGNRLQLAITPHQLRN